MRVLALEVVKALKINRGLKLTSSLLLPIARLLFRDEHVETLRAIGFSSDSLGSSSNSAWVVQFIKERRMNCLFLTQLETEHSITESCQILPFSY